MLDPTTLDTSTITKTINKGDLPSLTKRQLNFGYVPDISALHPGDLLLTQNVGKSDIVSVCINWAQKPQYSENGLWTHAAVYAKDWRFIEATPENNVSNGTLLQWIPDTKILVRRPTFFKTLSPHDAYATGMAIALEAAMLQGVGIYGKDEAIGIWARLLDRTRRKLTTRSETSREALVCSGLYAKCFNIATQVQLLTYEMQRNDEPITPALLANISTFYDVDIGWVKLV